MTNTVSDTVSDETLNAIIQIESGGNPRAKASTSSALGLFQFLNGTWLSVVRKHRPDLLEGRSAASVLALRLDPEICIDLGARFTEDNLLAIGRNATGGDLYLAHFLGAGAARAVFRAAPNTPIAEVVSEDAIKANASIMRGKTCAQVRAWAARRMHESAGHNWIAKYCPAPAVEEPAPEEFPDPQQQVEPVPTPKPRPAPAAPEPAPEPPAPPAAKETFIEWVKAKGKIIMSWFTGTTLLTGGLGATTDWRIVAVIVGGLLLAGAVLAVFYLATRKAA